MRAHGRVVVFRGDARASARTVDGGGRARANGRPAQSDAARGRSRVSSRARVVAASVMDEKATVVPAPTCARLDACRASSWRAHLDARATFRAVAVAVPAAFVRYALADGVVCEETDASLPRRVKSDAFEAVETARRFEEACAVAEKEEEEKDAAASDGERRATFAAFEGEIQRAIEALGGEVAPKFAWSAPKDATWVTAGNTMKCRNVDEVVLLLKASDAVAHDLTEAYCACEDYARDENESEEARAVREHASTVLTLREWYDLNPSMEFRCFVKSKNLIAVAQRHVNDYFEFLAREKDAIEDAIATFWEANVSTTSWHDEQVDYVFDVYVTPKQKKVKIIDFNVWGGTTLPLLFGWHELETIGAKQPSGGDARGYADDIEFRIIESQGNILPGLQLGVPYDLYDMSEGGAISEFLEEQRKRQESEH